MPELRELLRSDEREALLFKGYGGCISSEKRFRRVKLGRQMTVGPRSADFTS